jgi:hypothetical protein
LTSCRRASSNLDRPSHLAMPWSRSRSTAASRSCRRGLRGGKGERSYVTPTGTNPRWNVDRANERRTNSSPRWTPLEATSRSRRAAIMPYKATRAITCPAFRSVEMPCNARFRGGRRGGDPSMACKRSPRCHWLASLIPAISQQPIGQGWGAMGERPPAFAPVTWRFAL